MSENFNIPEIEKSIKENFNELYHKVKFVIYDRLPITEDNCETIWKHRERAIKDYMSDLTHEAFVKDNLINAS